MFHTLVTYSVCLRVCVAEEQSYTLRDAEAEVLFGFSLEESLKRANSAPLFKVKQHVLHLNMLTLKPVQLVQ